MKIFLLFVGWVVTISALVGFAITMVICFCDPREKGEDLDEPKRSAQHYNSHEEDYIINDQDSHRLDEEPSQPAGIATTPSNTRA